MFFKLLKELESYFHESAARAYRIAQQKDRGWPDGNTSCCYYAEHAAYLHAADMTKATIKQHQEPADRLKQAANDALDILRLTDDEDAANELEDALKGCEE